MALERKSSHEASSSDVTWLCLQKIISFQLSLLSVKLITSTLCSPREHADVGIIVPPVKDHIM